MKNKVIKIKALEGKKDLGILTKGDIVTIRVWREEDYYGRERRYYGPAVFVDFHKTSGLLTFCSPRADERNCEIYVIPTDSIRITPAGTISAPLYAYYMGREYNLLIKRSNLK